MIRVSVMMGIHLQYDMIKMTVCRNLSLSGNLASLWDHLYIERDKPIIERHLLDMYENPIILCFVRKSI